MERGQDRSEIERLADDELDREERRYLTGLLSLDSLSTSAGLAALALAPVVGGALAQLVGDQVHQRRGERFLDWANAIQRGIVRVEERLDGDYAKSDELADLVEDILEQVFRRSSDGKRAYYAAAVANSLTRQRPAVVERDRMLAILNDIRLAQLEVLAVVAGAASRSLLPGQAGSGSSVLKALMPDREFEQIRMDWDDLANWKILQGFPGGMVTRFDQSDLEGQLTDFGRRFVAWISLLEEAPVTAAEGRQHANPA